MQIKSTPSRQFVKEIAYVTRDARATARYWADTMNIGPWLVMESFQSTDTLYRGTPVDLDLTMAFAFSGHVYFEFVQQNCDTDSIFNEADLLAGDREIAFHHWAFLSSNYDEDIARQMAAGGDIALSGKIPAIGDIRYAYIDCLASIGGMVEYIEAAPEVHDFLANLHSASAEWDGTDTFL